MKSSAEPAKIFVQANAFYFANVRLRGNDMPPAHIKVFAGPSLVLSAFASELYFKCLQCIERGRYDKGHNLKNLFRSLSPATRKRIKEKWDADIDRNAGARELIEKQFGERIPADLDWALTAGARGFEELRYSFDPENANSKFFLTELPRMLREVIIEMKPEWSPQ
ncbi:hypothetical protein [Methyloceanibacter sp. wino2]|uniref:hypothetical protein n=1 Tax=Methyloceanibacter sp. wino2 TaxID=2170729 RepID=UPI000D3EA096|nr:hypothetical protein [Methyloceanibacter sp. wino2]